MVGRRALPVSAYHSLWRRATAKQPQIIDQQLRSRRTSEFIKNCNYSAIGA